MPGIGEEIEGAMQHAPQPSRQGITGGRENSVAGWADIRLARWSYPAVTAEATPTNYRRRWLESFAFIAVWMALGWGFHLSANAYLVTGVPLVAAFQLLVRREPLVTLWVRRVKSFRLGWAGRAFAVLFAATPAWDLYQRAGAAPLSSVLWYVAAIIGAFGAGFALENMSRQDGRALLYGLSTAGLIGCGFMVLAALSRGLHLSGQSLAVGLHSFLQYVPVCFMVEEVAFRGLLDSHLHHPGDTQPGWSAVLLSCAWGLWHLPVSPLAGGSLAVKLGALMLVHGLTGIYLSNTWRSCGNLLATAVIHAFIDAVRNGLMHQ